MSHGSDWEDAASVKEEVWAMEKKSECSVAVGGRLGDEAWGSSGLRRLGAFGVNLSVAGLRRATATADLFTYRLSS